jgi:hypothetical protein
MYRWERIVNHCLKEFNLQVSKLSSSEKKMEGCGEEEMAKKSTTRQV